MERQYFQISTEEFHSLHDRIKELERENDNLRHGLHIPKLEEQVRREAACKIAELRKQLARSKDGHDTCRKEHKKRCEELQDAIRKAQGFRNELADLRKQLAAAEDEMQQQAEIIGKSIDDNDKMAMEFRAMEVELERKLAATEAKLGRAEEWERGFRTELLDFDPDDPTAKLRAILASEREVLAVVDVDIIHIDEEQGCIVEIMLPWTEDSEATVIVLRGEGK